MACSAPICVCLLALVVSQLGPLFMMMNIFGRVGPDKHSCNLLGKPLVPTSEDLTIFKWGQVFVSAGNIKYVVANAPAIPNGDIFKANIEKGRIGMVDVGMNGEDSCVQLLPMDNMPPEIAFHSHGIFFSNATKRLFAISHGLANGGSGVFVFNVIEHEGEVVGDRCVGDESQNIRLQFVRFISSPLFQNIGPNDVIEGLSTETTSEIYLTKWLIFPGNMAGKWHPKGLTEILQTIGEALVMVDLPQNFVWLTSRLYRLMGLNYSDDSVFRCVWDELCMGDECVTCAPVVKNLISANGITVTPDRKKIFVVDLPQVVHEYDRQADGSLLETGSIYLPTVADNIEYDFGSGDIYVGSIPTAMISMIVMTFQNPPIVAGGGLVVLHKEDSGDWKALSSVLHNGTKLSQISSAPQHGNKVLMGSPISRGVLECTL